MEEIYFDFGSPDFFTDENDLYNWLLDIHQEFEIVDLSDVLDFFVSYERYDYYMTVKRFIANELDKE